MAKRRGPRDDSSISDVAKQQRIAGTKSGPQEGRPEPSDRQPPQTSGRRSARHEHQRNVRRGYEASENPEAQGDGDPGPDQIRELPSLQGHAGRAHSGRGGSNVTERAHGGEPAGGHTREGRQRLPGDRDPASPS
jgi:hypothetical protein